MGYISRILPRTRVDAYEYLVKMKRQFNQGQVLPLAVSLLTDAIYTKGLDEGWIKWDPAGEVMISRSKSVDNDEMDLVARAGRAIEDADAIAGPDMPPEAPGYKIQDDGVKVADNEAAVAQEQLDQYQAGESVDRMAYMQGWRVGIWRGERATASGPKAAKGYEVVDETGEALPQLVLRVWLIRRPKKPARRAEMQRQLAERSQGDDLEMISSRQELLLSDNKGKVKLSDANLRDVGAFDEGLAKAIREDAATGGKVKRTYALTQRQMAELSEAITRGLDDGSIPASSRGSMTSLRDKLDTQVKVLSKEASLERWATKSVDGVIELLATGKICKPLG